MASVQLKRWTRDEYDRLVSAGILRPEDRVELLDGEIVVTLPQNAPHFTAIQLAAEAFRAAFGPGFVTRVQGPFNAGAESEPEPDVAVVPGRPRDYGAAHPSTAVLIVEVSESTLAYDRERKGPVYARAAIPEYWIVNLVDRVVEVYRGPRSDGTWANRSVHAEGEAITPPHAPAAAIAVSDLLP